MNEHDEKLIKEYFQQLRANITQPERTDYTLTRVQMIKEFIEKPSHEQHHLINFERHWLNDND